MEGGVFAKIVKLDRTQSKCWPRHTDSLRKGVFFDYTYFSSYTWLEQQVVFAAFACNGRRRCWHGRRRHEVLQTGGGLARIVSFFCQMGVFFDGLWCIQANLSSPRCRTHDAAVAFRQIINQYRFVNWRFAGTQRRPAVPNRWWVFATFALWSHGILISRMQSMFEKIFIYKDDSDARKWRWMRVFAHLCLMKTFCGKKFAPRNH